MVWKWSKFPCVEIICVFSLIIKAGEINSTAHYFPNLLWQWSKIIIETHCIGHVYFENIGLWNHRTYSLHAQSNFSNFTQLFFLMNLFTGQVLERARVRSVWQRSLILFLIFREGFKKKCEKVWSFAKPGGGSPGVVKNQTAFLKKKVFSESN